jgi:uncharacterized protein
MVMKNRTLLILSLAVIFSLVLIAGCTQPKTVIITKTEYTAVNATPAGLANPASVSCNQTGGTVEIKKDAANNEYGMCTFKNGTSCEEWALFRGEGCKPR